MKTLLAVLLVAASAFAQQGRKTIDLSSSKRLTVPAPGAPHPVDSFPATAVLSPDGKYLALLNSGYGTMAGGLRQGITVIDSASGNARFFPDDRLAAPHARQTYFIGLAFSSDGSHLYASMGSLSDPLAKKKGSTGNGIAVYNFSNGEVSPERFLSIAPQPIDSGKKRARALAAAPAGTAPPFPAGIAVIAQPGAADELLVADNLSDDVVLLDSSDGKILKRFDLSAGDWVPSQFPYQVAVSKDGKRAWVSLWNASAVAELDLTTGAVTRRISVHAPKSPTEPGSHPSALLLYSDGTVGGDYLFVALANTDEVAVVAIEKDSVLRYLKTGFARQKEFGSVPIALSTDGTHLYVANSSSDTAAVFNLEATLETSICLDCSAEEEKRTEAANQKPMLPLGFIPTEWYPTALVVHGDDLFVVSAKAQGTGPNSGSANGIEKREHPYIMYLLHGSVARLNIPGTLKDLPALTKQALADNLMNGRSGSIPFKSGTNPIKHVIYVIRENRTYDQILGDMTAGDSDPGLVMYGKDVTPNAHALAAQFGLLDNFYDSGEVSGDGHIWSTAAIASDYTEQTIQISYRGKERSYDSEGLLNGEYPLFQGIPDMGEPGSSYLWTDADRHGVSHRNYGEYISTAWCDKGGESEPPGEAGTPLPVPGHCATAKIEKGQPLPSDVGDPRGGPSPWPWPVPEISREVGTKAELRDHFDPKFPGFRLDYPDQLRADEFLNEFDGFVRARQAGNDTMPALTVLRLPNDHTAGTSANMPRPRASVADNDIALGRIVEAISNSPYWDDTAILVLEDDAQNGADHVDAHRSVALVISKYAPRVGPAAASQQIFIDHHFYTTVNMIRTVEVLLGLPPMNNNDAQAAVMAPLFSGDGTQPPFKTIWTDRDNGMIYEMNPPKGPGAAASAKMDFTHADAAPVEALNRILWRDAKGNVPYPKPKHTVIPAALHSGREDER
jgi:DNA-binding beta-propeller fold protein YncE